MSQKNGTGRSSQRQAVPENVRRFRRILNCQPSRFCPLLGIWKDPSTHYRFPSNANVCFAKEKPRPLDAQVQLERCLSLNHMRCRRFLERMAYEVHNGTEPVKVKNTGPLKTGLKFIASLLKMG